MRGARVVVAVVLLSLWSLALGSPARPVGAAPAWQPVAAMATGRSGHTATLLTNGMVLVAGGQLGVASAERYDPATDRWTPSTPAVPRAYHTASLLPDGRVLVAGGLGREGDPAATATTEIYDPKTNSWTAAAPLGQPRFGHGHDPARRAHPGSGRGQQYLA